MGRRGNMIDVYAHTPNINRTGGYIKLKKSKKNKKSKKIKNQKKNKKSKKIKIL